MVDVNEDLPKRGATSFNRLAKKSHIEKAEENSRKKGVSKEDMMSGLFHEPRNDSTNTTRTSVDV